MSDEVMALGNWRTNAHLLADVAALGYVSGSVLDLSHGKNGGFWKVYRPPVLTTNDISEEFAADFHYDARHTPWADASFDTVVWDAPYKLAGTPKSGEMDQRFGTAEYRSRDALAGLLIDGMTEAARLSRQWVLVKTMDQVNGGKVRWMTDIASQHGARLGMRKADSFIFRSGRPQPAGRRQLHARRNFSTLLVFSW